MIKQFYYWLHMISIDEVVESAKNLLNQNEKIQLLHGET
jgi:hypothetical protein